MDIYEQYDFRIPDLTLTKNKHKYQSKKTNNSFIMTDDEKEYLFSGQRTVKSGVSAVSGRSHS